jgi:hypothetical protein
VRDNSVISSSASPSAKYSCSTSPDIFVNGNTAMPGRLEAVSAAATMDAGVGVASCCGLTRQTRSGSAMCFSAWLPPSSNSATTVFLTKSCTVPEIQIPPGSANSWRRAATLTPSP